MGCEKMWQHSMAFLIPLIFTLTQLLVAFEDLQIEVLEQKLEKCDRKVRNGDILYVHYVGKLASDSSVFESSSMKDEPFSFQIGKRQVIRGWDQGLMGMCVGEKRKLMIPARLAFQTQGNAVKGVPADADLIYEVELLKLEQPPHPLNVFKSIDVDGDRQLSPHEVGTYLRLQIPTEMSESDEIPKFDEHKMVQEIFHHEDKDRNGFISHEEFSGPKHDEL